MLGESRVPWGNGYLPSIRHHLYQLTSFVRSFGRWPRKQSGAKAPPTPSDIDQLPLKVARQPVMQTLPLLTGVGDSLVSILSACFFV